MESRSWTPCYSRRRMSSLRIASRNAWTTESFHAVKNDLIAKGSILELGNVIRDPRLGRTDDDQITIADLTGVAIQDIQIASVVNRALVERGGRG